MLWPFKQRHMLQVLQHTLANLEKYAHLQQQMLRCKSGIQDPAVYLCITNEWHLPVQHAPVLRPKVQRSLQSDECLYDHPVLAIVRHQRPKLQYGGSLCFPRDKQCSVHIYKSHCTLQNLITHLDPHWCGDHQSRYHL